MTTRPNFLPRLRAHPADLWAEAGIEPSLQELLNDPLVHQVMRRDGVTPGELAGVVARARLTLRRGLCRLAA